MTGQNTIYHTGRLLEDSFMSGINRKFVALFVSVHRAPHLLCCLALEVQGVRLRTRRLASAAPCKRLQFGGLR